MEEIKKTDSNTKTQLSLAAALFFSPLVQNMLNKNTRDISEKDISFIRGYIKFWYITLLLGLITIAAWIMNYLFVLDILSMIYTVSIFILMFLLLISVVSILSDISLLKWRDHSSETYTIEGNKKDILVKYLPIYNIYLWYSLHTFDKPNWRIKESILLWTIFFIVSSTWSVWGSTIVLIALVVRVAALMSDIDFLNIPTKKILNTLFFKNPEEIIGYITGFFIYLTKSFVHIFTKIETYTLEWEVAKQKEYYGHIIDIRWNTQIIIEYILWILLIIWLAYTIKPDFSVRTYYLGGLLLVARYTIMAIQLKHLPHFPITGKLMMVVQWIGNIFKKKSSFIPNK